MNWDYLAEARFFYESQGFKYIDVPWFVPQHIDNITRPGERKSLVTDLGNFVGSAEQSFLWLAQQGKITKGKYCTITPCVRLEPNLDELHQNGFMKLELFHYEPENEDALSGLISAARDFYVNKLGIFAHYIRYSNYEWDLEDSIFDIELGSYGQRIRPFANWVYGTGCAEPRTSYVYNKQMEYFKSK